MATTSGSGQNPSVNFLIGATSWAQLEPAFRRSPDQAAMLEEALAAERVAKEAFQVVEQAKPRSPHTAAYCALKAAYLRACEHTALVKAEILHAYLAPSLD